MFGRGARKAAEHDLYLEVVPVALPPVPGGYEKRAIPVDGPWVVLRVFHLDPHDLAATKLRRFAARDREDIRQLCDLGLLDPTELEATLGRAFWMTMDKDGDPYRDDTFAHLRIVLEYLRGERPEF